MNAKKKNDEDLCDLCGSVIKPHDGLPHLCKSCNDRVERDMNNAEAEEECGYFEMADDPEIISGVETINATLLSGWIEVRIHTDSDEMFRVHDWRMDDDGNAEWAGCFDAFENEADCFQWLKGFHMGIMASTWYGVSMDKYSNWEELERVKGRFDKPKKRTSKKKGGKK